MGRPWTPCSLVLPPEDVTVEFFWRMGEAPWAADFSCMGRYREGNYYLQYPYDHYTPTHWRRLDSGDPGASS